MSLLRAAENELVSFIHKNSYLSLKNKCTIQKRFLIRELIPRALEIMERLFQNRILDKLNVKDVHEPEEIPEFTHTSLVINRASLIIVQVL